MTEHYRGNTRRHAVFWVHYHNLSLGRQFAEFINFFKGIEAEVDKGKCDLRAAGYALEPGYYDKAIQADPHGGDMTIACLRATDLANWAYEDREEAEEDWQQIVSIMKKYTSR
jgi:hypothetical protein